MLQSQVNIKQPLGVPGNASATKGVIEITTAGFGGNIAAVTSSGSYKIEVVRNFNASRSSAVYGKSGTVQPHAITCFIWRRIA